MSSKISGHLPHTADFSISGHFVWSLNSIDVVNLHFNDLIVPVEPLLSVQLVCSKQSELKRSGE